MDLCGDNRFELIEKYRKELIEATNIESSPDEMAVLNTILFRFWQMGWLDRLEKKKQGWIPITTRPMTDEERTIISERFGFDIEYDEPFVFTSPMPDDGQKILVSYRQWISIDKCEIDNGYYGLADNDDWDGVVAWMPLPEPYKEVTE